ncbi:interleukin-34 isoform X2 [Ascaphus truei]|uniref:interleukin-34 isoform X2 n=1 Tax=Ascaphus truei TaxID=8439 RepID=UPI003F59916C
MQSQIVVFLCILVLGRAAIISNDCKTTQTLNERLMYDKRLIYMGEYFPLDYKIYVRYEEVLRCQNITNLINQGITVKELRYLWGIVNERVLFKIKEVLPGRHPSFGYITDLLSILKSFLPETEHQVDSEIINEVLVTLKKETETRKPVRPKALLDNCFKVFHLLYEEECRLCNPRSASEGETFCESSDCYQ